MKRSRAENAGRAIAHAIVETAQLMYQKNTRKNFLKGIAEVIECARAKKKK